MDMSEILSIDFSTSNLQILDFKEMPADRIAALAFTDRLGSTLWNAKYRKDRESIKTAVYLVAHELRRKTQRWTKMQQGLVINIAIQAMNEWLNDVCPKCRGVGIIKVGGYRGGLAREFECSKCRGLGRKRWSDSERSKGVGVPRQNWSIYWDDKLGEALEIITDAAKKVTKQMHFQLERKSV